MGLGGINIWQLLIILVIVVLLFGTKKLKNLGSDLGGAVKGFKDSVNDDKDEKKSGAPESLKSAHTDQDPPATHAEDKAKQDA